MSTSSYLKLYHLLLSIALLQYCEYDVNAVTTISHPRTASVCSGAQLELICTSTRTLLRWVISIPNGTASRMYSRALTINSQEWQIQDNLTTFTFSVISNNSLMLTSRLVISPTNDDLNRTEVNCVDDDGTSSSTIDIIDKAATFGTQLETSISVRSEQFESDGVLTLLEWTQENSLYSYYITVTPDMALWINGSASVNLELRVPYNTSYNISVVATPPCGQDPITRSTELLFHSYSLCGNPADQVLGDGVTVTGHTIPTVIGSNITLSCMSGTVQIGPNSSVCGENGEWEPDLREVHCITIGGTTEVDVIDLDVQTPFNLSQNGKIAIASAVIFVVTFIFALIIGFLCGRLCGKQRKTVPFPPAPEKGQISPPDNPALNQIFYENVLELQENASYASVK